MNHNKQPAFLIADNPMTDSDEYVIHTRYPVCIIRMSPKPDGGYYDDCVWMEPLPDESPLSTDPLRLTKLMRRACDWFHAYCVWEEQHSHDDNEL